MSKIAWSGELMLLEAKWTDKDGHLAKFKIVSPNEARPNPFKPFTKRKKGRAGTRFRAALAHVGEVRTDGTTYDGEVMLAGWADTSTQGYTVTFWVEPPEEGLHPFEGFVRLKDSFMAVLVELDDDNQEIDQDQRDRVEKATDTTKELGASMAQAKEEFLEEHGAEVVGKLTEGMGIHRANKPEHMGPRPLSNYAALLCTNAGFWVWINDTQLTTTEPRVFDKDTAAEWMRKKLGIDSRADLDTMDGKAKMYHERCRKPFVVWQETQSEYT